MSGDAPAWMKKHAPAIRAGIEAGKTHAEIGAEMGLKPGSVRTYARVLGLARPMTERSRAAARKIEAVRTAAAAGKTVVETAEEMGISTDLAYVYASRGGVKFRSLKKHKMAAQHLAEYERMIAQDYAAGVPVENIARRLNMTDGEVRSIAKRDGLVHARSSRKNSDAIQMAGHRRILLPYAELWRPKTCQYIAGASHRDAKCGRPVDPGSAYCAEHRALCCRPPLDALKASPSPAQNEGPR